MESNTNEMNEKGVNHMGVQQIINDYNKQLVDEKQMFRDLFGKQELNEAISKWYAREFNKKETLMEFLRNEKRRKLEEQDGD